MHVTIRVEWRRQDGTTATEELVTQNQDACKSAGDVGLPLAEAKRIVAWLQGIVEQGSSMMFAADDCGIGTAPVEHVV
jgi:hypothetical protein